MKIYTQSTKLNPQVPSLLTWTRADLNPLTRGACAVVVDHREATGLDPAAEGSTQMYADPDNVTLPPFDQLAVAIASPYPLDIVRRRDYDHEKHEQPAIMGAVWQSPHPAQWLAELEFGAMIVVVPDIGALTQRHIGAGDLKYAWFAAAGVALAQR
jgi:hypothetical protein